ncbi:MAG: methylated-DNA-[protein]-cysteine S-methyltransferase [Chloroflexota bacterium]|nr:methylated-DNA-[protein]-cysteine S-methyltransferase [Chloroflexota bacterium]
MAVAMIDGSPAGSVVVAASDAGVAYVSFHGLQDFKALILDKANIPSTQALELVHTAGRQIQEYFDHKRKDFDLPLDMESLTDFQRRVLRETARIPYGTAITYGEVAARMGQPKASRAVGGALARNPLAIVVPCHRVVDNAGRMHGFSAPGGIETKIALLKLEGCRIQGDRLVR